MSSSAAVESDKNRTYRERTEKHQEFQICANVGNCFKDQEDPTINFLFEFEVDFILFDMINIFRN